MIEKLIADRFNTIRELAAGTRQELLSPPWVDFLTKEASFLAEMEHLREQLHSGSFYEQRSEEDLSELNHRLYADVLPENYASCYGNPSYAVSLFGLEAGRCVAWLYAELRGALPLAYENKKEEMLELTELFLQIYSDVREHFEQMAKLSSIAAETELGKKLQEDISSYCMKYLEERMDERTRETLDPSSGLLLDILLHADFESTAFLYRSGEYVTKNEIQLATFLASLPQEEIDAIAATFTEGFRRGFEVQKKDLTRKKTVNLRYRLGFERIIRSAVLQFQSMGLQPVLYRAAVHAVNKRGTLKIGFYGAVPNPQYDYDHREDSAAFLDEAFVQAKLRALRKAYEHHAELARVHAGPALFDSFGEKPFESQNVKEAFQLSKEQRQLEAKYSAHAGLITNRFIKGDERSFTIIAYPVPELMETLQKEKPAFIESPAAYAEIFREIERVNNLDNALYQRIQQRLIDALDEGIYVTVKGRKGNATDLTIRLHPLADPAKQTNFENCVADVNIPVGEVFTSPVLKGTKGTLEVSDVYLEGFRFRNLRIVLEDGMVKDYSCSNFSSREENRRSIEDHILYHHPTLPIGEFAIGTNTTAYRLAEKHQMAGLLPILIAEKMGPHFAFGDTCYSYAEDLKVLNPDGKEMIARDNERSILRKTRPEKAYFNCHTDVTLPYKELGEIRVHRRDGSTILLLSDGRFVLPGTEALNEPLDAD